MMKDDRMPSHYAVDMTPKWDSLTDSNKLGVTVRLRTEAILDYPQVDQGVYDALRAKAEAWAKTRQNLDLNPNQEALDILSDQLANEDRLSDSSQTTIDENGCLIKILFFVGMVILIFVVAWARS